MTPALYPIDSDETTSPLSSMMLPSQLQSCDIIDIHVRVDNIHETPEIDFDSSDSSPDTPKPEKRLHSRARAKRIRKASSTPSVPTPTLRPAKDILSRIRHDPTLDVADYLIGYHDRIEGLMEIKVEDWKGGDVTDEEFIPQHRIMYFRRASDSVRVWDRKRRLDELFGSGVPGGLSEESGEKERDKKGEIAEIAIENEGETAEVEVENEDDRTLGGASETTDAKDRRALAAEKVRLRLEKNC